MAVRCQSVGAVLQPRGADMGSKRAARGFTLLELMVVLIIVAIVLTFAVPSYRTLILNRRINGLTDNLFNSLSYARNLALSNDEPVTVCPYSAPGSTACGSNWSAGWIVVKQPPQGASAVLNTTVLGAGGPTLKATAYGGSTSISTITFNGRGLLNTSQQVLLTACDSRGAAQARSILVYSTGSMQTSNQSNQTSNQPRVAADGTTPLSCP